MRTLNHAAHRSVAVDDGLRKRAYEFTNRRTRTPQPYYGTGPGANRNHRPNTCANSDADGSSPIPCCALQNGLRVEDRQATKDIGRQRRNAG
jgi:hypothetical protein